MGVVLSTAPPAFGFSKDLLSAFFTCDDYALKTNYAIHFKLFLEKADYSGYDEIYDTRLYLLPGSSGQVEAVIADKLHDAISADIAKLHPDIPDQGQALVCQKSCRKYYFQYREVHDGSDGPFVLFNTSPTYTILHGGLSFRAQFSTTLANLLQPAAPAQDRFLKQGNVNCYTRTNQPQYLYFFNGRDFSGSTELRVKYFYDDNTEGTGVLHSFSMQAFRKYAFHVGYSSLSPASNKRLVKYEVWLQQGSNKRSETRTYLMNYQIRDYVRYFLNWSSWGGLDTRLCYGQGNAEFELFQKEAKKQLKQGFDIKSGQYTVYDVYGQSQFTVATGWMSREDLIHFRDFYLSSIKYRYVGGLLMPIQVTSRNITELSDGNHLHAQEFQYRYLYDDHAYTEGDIEEPGQGFGDFFFSSGPVDNPTGGYTETDPTVPYWVKQITLDDIVKWNAGASFNPSDYLTQTTADGRYVTQATDQLSLPGNKGWTGRHHFTGALAIPQTEPLTPVSGQAYIWFGTPGGGSTPPPAYGNLEDLQNVANVIDDGKYLRKVGGQWVGVDISFPDLSGYATQSWVNSQGFLKSPDLAAYATQAWSNGRFVTQATEQLSLSGNKGWTGRHHFTGALSIPQEAPIAPVAGQAYVWFGSPGSGSTPPPAFGNLEDLQNVADVIDDGKYLRKVGGQWIGVDITFPDLSGYATQSWVNAQGFIKAPDLSAYATQAWATGQFVTQATEQLSLSGNKGWTGRHHFTGALSIPQEEPSAPVSGQAYIWFGSPGSGGTPPPAYGNLEDLQNVADSIDNGKYLRKVGGEWTGVDITFPDLSGYATQSWVTAGFAPISHTHTIAQVTGLQSALDGKEPAFVKNSAFNKNFGTTSGTVAQGDDSRIVNGQTAFGWGNHQLAGYAVRAADNTFTAHNHFSGALSIPQAAPSEPHAGQAYVWFGSPGSGGGGGVPGTLAGLDDVALSSLANNQLIRYNSSTGTWVNFTASYAPASHTHPISQITGLQAALDGKEPAFSKNTGFNRPFGTTANTVAQGNDSRIIASYNYSQIGHLPLTGGTLEAVGTSNPLILSRATNQVSLRFLNDTHTIFLGMTSSGELRTGISGDLNTTGNTIWHSGNLANGTTSQYIRGNGSLATFPTIGTGTLSLSTGTGLQGSASFGANQTGNVSFSVSAASGYVIPTTTQRNNWNTAFGWGDYRQFGLGNTMSNSNSPNSWNWDNISFNSIHRGNDHGITGISDNIYGISLFNSPSSKYGIHIAGHHTNRLFIQGHSPSNTLPWVEIWHSGNLANGTTAQYIRGNGSLATFPTIGNGTLSMTTGTGLSGSATFSANQTGNTTFSVSAASGYVIPTTTQRNNWNAAYGWGNHAGLYVTMSGNQTGIGGNKTWTGAHTWDLSTNASPSGNLIIGIGRAAAGNYLMGRSSTGQQNFALRTYATNGVQLVLLEGGISLPPAAETTGGISFGTTSVLRETATGNLIIASPSGSIYLRPTSTSSSVGQIIVSPNGATSFSGKITCPVIEPTAFIVPATAPSSPESGRRYLWVS